MAIDFNNPYVVSIGIVIGSVILAVFARRILGVLGKITKKTRTKLDEIILDYVRFPIQILILSFGLFFAIQYTGADISIGQVTLNQIFAAVWVFAVAFLAAKIIKALFAWYTEELREKLTHKIDEALFIFVRRIINISVYIIAAAVIFRQFGVEITPLLAGLGIAGIAIGLALKDTLANFFSALYITVDRPMRIGDFVEIDENTSGYVKDIGWRTTRLKTWDGNYLVIPNAKIAESVLRNYNAPANEMTVTVNCGVAYNSDLEKVEKIAIDVAKKIQKSNDGAVDDFEPFVRFKEFGDSSINFTAYLKVKDRPSRFRVTHVFIKALKKAFDKEKISIPFPQRDVHMKK